MTQKEYIAKLVKFYNQEESLKEEIAEVKADAKEAGFDPAVLSTVAKAMVKNKVDELLEKSQDTISAVNLARS